MMHSLEYFRTRRRPCSYYGRGPKSGTERERARCSAVAFGILPYSELVLLVVLKSEALVRDSCYHSYMDVLRLSRISFR